jgi:hypothetical protein
MTPASPPAPRPYRRLRVPAFQPVPTRTRRDGWTIERQADFLGMLAETGSVIGACEAVGISRKSAYQLRARPGAMALRPLDHSRRAPRRTCRCGWRQRTDPSVATDLVKGRP